MTAARRIVDADGLEALTMRRLADALKLQLPAIYRVFTNKQTLLDELAEAILAEALPDGRGDHWTAEVALLAGQLRTALLAQRDGARIVGGSYAAKRNTLTYADRFVGIMRQAGLDGTAALWATSTVFCYVLGEALEQQGQSADALDRLDRNAARETYPQLFATPVEEIVNFDERFEFGLGLILDGLRQRLHSAGPAEPGAGRARPAPAPPRPGHRPS
ncbi:TetR/AcrR family transcriptional regulator [Streptomyces qinzhouensis]|uniref:TetR/AcrR family transcriptional regulator n=1 Tax=Streptomyces qinzhouensis TaxID=2599401 RepID=A0A5B8IRV3_9ACTN|nr:TetR/AcrR family transcriptional regulator [Streptomyces qinzhouensis]